MIGVGGGIELLPRLFCQENEVEKQGLFLQSDGIRMNEKK
jgi:hypothetical protein